MDEERGSSLSMIHEDISYNALIVVVLEDFGIDDNKNIVNLSYVSPSKLNFGTKVLPPTFIRNDRQVTSYLNKLQENGGLHLCVTIKVMMIEICSICGEWKLINGIHWDFIVDDERGSSISMIHEDINYNSLIVAVLEDFGIDANRNNVSLSYVSPSKLNFGAKELPPAFIRNDRQVTSYLKKLQENGGLYLCVIIKIQDEVLITNDLPIAGSRNFCQRGTQKSPLIMSNMIQTQDEISSTHDSPIAGSSNVFESTERVEAIYPLLKDVALSPDMSGGSNAMKQMFTFSLRSARKGIVTGNPVLAEETTSIAIWCVLQFINT
ncbi:hypothetical protein DY000_02012990 [Brassica cretica]|uniref:Uncharacterized protein n=1 Tax=Brassica cretica TaxID=69181 RepID=A0ABQ7D6P8_BRACR|nr:hypothetical protein DY000_02012990 [Brassica cretica]